jgi:tRNA pseudouridine38-40 synthase
MRYFIHLGFDGNTYSGWQRQKATSNTVQEVLEQTLSSFFKKRVSVYGCGRTDAGVHASQFVLQVDLDEAPSFDLKFRMNKNLPNSISIFEVIKVDENQHCRHDAVARTYDYFIHLSKNPILSYCSSLYEDLELDFNLMKDAAALILETKDFRPLCKKPDLYDNTLCEISNCELFVNEEQGRLRFTITSNRFLRGMIRICVFCLLEVGKGTMSLDELRQILNQEKELKEKTPAYPNGLFLSKIKYPFLELNDSQNVVKMLSAGLE